MEMNDFIHYMYISFLYFGETQGSLIPAFSSEMVI